ncbi:hypothetical protein D3C83_278810 [compost metagenome]
MTEAGTVLTSRDYAVSASIAAPLYGGNFSVTDTIVVPAAAAGTTFRVVVGVDQD